MPPDLHVYTWAARLHTSTPPSFHVGILAILHAYTWAYAYMPPCGHTHLEVWRRVEDYDCSDRAKRN